MIRLLTEIEMVRLRERFAHPPPMCDLECGCEYGVGMMLVRTQQDLREAYELLEQLADLLLMVAESGQVVLDSPHGESTLQWLGNWAEAENLIPKRNDQ